MKPNRGLGKGLSALFSETEEDYGKSLLFEEEPSQKGEGVTHVDISSIFANPNQPRKVFDETALTELAASIAAAIKKNTSMALGNIVGSNVFNIALILGLCSQVSPLTSTGIGIVDFAVMIAAALVLFIFGKDCKISRGEGVFLFLCFVAYNWYLISNQIA